MTAEYVTYQNTHDDLTAMSLLIERASAQRDHYPIPDQLDSKKQAELQELLQERLSAPEAWSHTAKVGNRLAGLAIGYSATRQIDHLSFLMVEPDYWGRQIASNLLDIVAEQAHLRGKRHVTLWTRINNNSHARQVYEHKGYLPTPQTRMSMYGQQVRYLLDLPELAQGA